MPPRSAVSQQEEQSRRLESSMNIAEIYGILKSTMGENPDLDLVERMAEKTFEANAKRHEALAIASKQPATVTKSDIIPSSKRKQLSGLPKLDKTNWHAWLRDVKAVTTGLKDVNTILFSDEEPDYNETLEEIDQELVAILRGMCDTTSSSNIRHIIDAKEGWTSGRELFKHLRQHLTKSDKVTASRLANALQNVKMYSGDIDKVINYVNEASRKASLVGIFFNDREKITALRHCSAHSQLYVDAWRMIDMTGINEDYEAVVTTLSNEWFNTRSNPYTREPRAAALAAEGVEADANRAQVSSSISPEEREARRRRGKRDPANPNEPPKCYECKEEGHIARDCPVRKKRLQGQRSATAASVSVSNVEKRGSSSSDGTLNIVSLDASK